jgi:2,4-dienoyl-CoA reductase-like NADH-dependent reductase (Old Yellow Enzyme family)
MKSKINRRQIVKSLFDTVQLGHLAVGNRIARSATFEGMAEESGEITGRLLRVYRNLAEGGAGLIFSSAMFISKEGQGLERQIGIHDDGMLPGLSELAGVIHERGAIAIAQIAYCGVQATFNVTDNTYNPSDAADPGTGKKGKPMSEEDIRKLQNDFVSAAHRAKKAGFDGVQIHVAHGYLLSQFLSPYMNRRTDAYGGSVENRIRIVSEIVGMIRSEIPGFPVLVKINATDEFDGGLVLSDAFEACAILEKSGVAAVEVSGGIVAAGKYNKAAIRTGIISPDHEGYFKKEAESISAGLKIPVISVGGYRSPDLMEKILNESGISMISMARPFLAEPDLANRWKSGDLKKSKCISCGKCRTADGNYCTVFGRTV